MNGLPFWVHPALVEPLRAWLNRVFGTSFGSGQSLKAAMQDVGMSLFPCESWDADNLLDKLVAAGWVRKAKNADGGYTLEPTREQSFFGIGGGRWDVKNTHGEHYAHLYGYEPVRECLAAFDFAWGRL